MELPIEASLLHLQPGEKVQVTLSRADLETHEEPTPVTIVPKDEVRGMLKGVVSSYAFNARKREEIELEERRFK